MFACLWYRIIGEGLEYSCVSPALVGPRVCLRCEGEIRHTCFQCIHCPPALVTRTDATQSLQKRFAHFRLGLDGPTDQLWRTFLESTPAAELRQALTPNPARRPVSYYWDCICKFLQSSAPEEPHPLDKVVYTSLKERVCTPQRCCFRILQPKQPQSRNNNILMSKSRVGGAATATRVGLPRSGDVPNSRLFRGDSTCIVQIPWGAIPGQRVTVTAVNGRRYTITVPNSRRGGDYIEMLYQ